MNKYKCWDTILNPEQWNDVCPHCSEKHTWSCDPAICVFFKCINCHGEWVVTKKHKSNYEY